MTLQVGDKVRFLNEKGEGIVTRILGNKMVNVAIEEGFELPVMVADLIKIDPSGMAGRFFDRDVNIDLIDVSIPQTKTPAPSRVSEPEPYEEAIQDDRVSSLYRQSGSATGEGLYLAYMPQDQKILLTGRIDIYLINNTAHDVLYSFLLRKGVDIYTGLDYDVVPPYSKIILESIEREDLEDWSEGIVQTLFYNEKPAVALAPLHASFRIKPVRFYKESNYQDLGLIGQKALVVLLGDIAGQIVSKGEDALKGIDPSVKQKVSAIAPPAFIDGYKTGLHEAEVDLHISALKDDYSQMSNSEILRYQIDHFTEMLNNAITNNYKKVVFIHGIGNGSLKSAVIKALADYENVEWRTAPFAKYGNGAVEIILHKNS
jgi:hypothetical protein